MGWFDKEDNKRTSGLPELPRLPELPKLPGEGLPQLPSFPQSSFGQQFSQNAIKDAVTGKKEVDYREDFEADELEETENERRMQEPLVPRVNEMRNVAHPMTSVSNISPRRNMTTPMPMATSNKNEPVFIRIDKFEQTLKIFQKTKNKIDEIEKMLRDIKKIKEKEEEELNLWENEIANAKEQIAKVDRDIFSKVE